MGYYYLYVYGTMLATGTESDTIVFTSGQINPTPNDWRSINFSGATSSGSILSFAKIQFGEYGIYCANNTSAMITSSLIQMNSVYGIHCYASSPTIQNNFITYNNNEGIFCHYSSPTINNNIIQNNGLGITCASSSPSIQNNTISNNSSIGIVCYLSSPTIQNNTISNNNSIGIQTGSMSSPTIRNNSISGNNQHGISCVGWNADSFPTIQNNTIIQNNGAGIRTDTRQYAAIFNNIIAGNIHGIDLNSAPSTLSYNLFWDNITLYAGSAAPAAFGEIVTQNANGDLCDTYLNLFMDPEFVDYANGDFNLLDTSPCIDAGNPNAAYYDPDGTISDIGAFYFDQGSAAPVISDFTADPVSGRQPLVVQFTNAITGPVTEFTWSFGDGTTSNQPNPVHVYTAMGTYDVSLLVTGPGGSDTKVKANYITVNAPLPPLVAKFTAAPLLGYAPLEVQFTNQSTGPWQTVLWDFGDGNTSTVSNPLHTYQAPGYYSVSLTITTLSTSKTEFKENYIHAIAPQEVVAMFEVSGNNGAAPYTVAFFDQSFGSVEALLWDFGNGITSTLANPMHTFDLPGEYVVSLTAFGPLNEDTSTETILVEAPAPVITQIVDRPNDQGGYVYIHFKKSFYDQVVPIENGRSTESYTIQRQDNGYWVSLNSVLAYGEAVYIAEAVTLADSTGNSNGMTNFRIIAGMDEGTWISAPAEGYSVDNIAPEAPEVLTYTLGESEISFSWNPSAANDFQYFAVYKSPTGGSIGGVPYATLTGTSFNELISNEEAWFYTVTAIDDAGNESEPSEELSTLRQMELSLPSGWSGISGYLNVYDPAIENIFAAAGDNLVIVYNNSGMYWPGQNINTLVNWQTTSGYQVKLTQPQNITLSGLRLTDRSLQLNAGWNLIPVLSECAVNTQGLFTGKDVVIIKEVAGWKLFWPQMGINTLQTLQPGKSYNVMMGTEDEIEFPECD